MTGGYSLIDCFDVNITSDPVKIEGIFKKYQMSKRKAFLLSNVTINNTQLNDVFSTPYFEDGKVCFPAYDGVIKISDTDYVTFEATADVIADKYLSKEDFLTIESDNTPYVSRTTRDGLVKIPQLVGGTVAWNQLVQNGNFADGTNNWNIEGGVTATVTDNVVTINSSVANNGINQGGINFNSNHKYLMAFDVSADSACEVRGVLINSSKYLLSLQANTSKQRAIKIAQYNGSAVNASFYIYAVTPATIYVSNVILIDLTQMFGTTIADYVNSLERTTKGSGLAWLQSYGFLTKDYYAYDAGSLQSVCTSGRKITALDGTVRTYPIENVELRGLFMLDANNKLYADGDIYPPSGSGRRKYVIVDLGTLNWYYDSPRMYSAVVSGLKPCPNNLMANILCVKYKTYRVIGQASGDDKTIGVSNDSRFYVYDTSYTDAATFKTAMSGVYAVCELAEETTFSADSYINPQRSEGTEEFIDGLTRDVMVPVGNNSTYYKDELFNIIGEYIDSCDDAVIAMIPEGE